MSTSENSTDGMRYRGHHHHNDIHHSESTSASTASSNNLDFDISNSSKKTATRQSLHRTQSPSQANVNTNTVSNRPPTDDEMSKPLLAHDYSQDDESTSTGTTMTTTTVAVPSTSLMTTIAGIARKVRCKVLDKLPISFATRFAVTAPPEERVAALRRFIEHHVNHVATASAAEDGLTPRQRHHYEMIKSLWERLNSRAPRCVRRPAGEESDEICSERLTGKVWGAFGFQGKDPATDFRGAGQLALEHMLYFVTKHPRTLEAIAETPADHAPITSHYPFAVASINITMLLLDMIKTVAYAPPPPPPPPPTSNSVSSSPAPTTSSHSSTTGNFHIGTYSAVEARRKLAHFITDPAASWKPPQPASSAVQNLNWTHKHFKRHLDTTMDDLFGPAVGAAQHRTQEELRKSAMTTEEQEMEEIAERLGAVYVAACVMLHDQWLLGKRNVMYFNEVFKQTAARLELLFRDSTSFSQVMNAVWKDY